MLPIHAILHPTDFSEHSEHAFHLACSLARDHGANLIVLHAWAPPTAMAFGEVLPDPATESEYEEAAAELGRMRPLNDDMLIVQRIEEGDPVSVILRVAEERCADLIVMGTHGRTGIRRLLMGSVAEQVVRRAACPVVTVKNPVPAETWEGVVREPSLREAAMI